MSMEAEKGKGKSLAAWLSLFSRSLVWKLAVAFWFVSLTGIILVAVFAGRLAKQQSAEFEDRFNRDVIMERLETYYQTNGGWPMHPLSRPPLSPRSNTDWTVLDVQDRIVFASHPKFTSLSEQQLRKATPIIVDEETVGQLIIRLPSPRTRELNGARTAFVRSFKRSIALGALGATVLALVMGIGFARRLTRPIQALTQAAHTIAQGKLAQQVAVYSDDELGQLANAFNQMGRNLAQAQQARRQMTADIAHDLRTPLAIIRGHSEGLLDGVLPANEETFSIIHDESLRLNRLIEDLRTLSLADAGELPLSLRMIEPRTLLERTLAVHKPLADEHNICLQLQIPATLPTTMLDPDRMAQVLDNLVGNALRYTPPGGSIILSIEVVAAKQHAAKVLRIMVQDDGQGIPTQDLAHIFDRFYRADKSRQRSHTHASSGSGLGLAISKSIVEQHEGTLVVSSQINQGTLFTIALPIKC